MKALITGATGMVGRKLCLEMFKKGIELNIITRNTEKAKETLPYPANFFEWKDAKSTPPKEAFEDVNVVINLAGENLFARRWNKNQKAKIYNSRVEYTRMLVKGLNAHATLPLDVFISVSGFNIYKANTNEIINENSPLGNDYLANLCKDWEKAALEFTGAKRTVIIRTPMVLSHDSEFVNKSFIPADFYCCENWFQRSFNALDPPG